MTSGATLCTKRVILPGFLDRRDACGAVRGQAFSCCGRPRGRLYPCLPFAIFVFTVRDRGVLHGCRTITITKDIVQKQVGIYLSLLSPTGYNIDMTIDGSESRGATEKHEHRQGANLRFAPVLPGENLTTFFVSKTRLGYSSTAQDIAGEMPAFALVLLPPPQVLKGTRDYLPGTSRHKQCQLYLDNIKSPSRRRRFVPIFCGGKNDRTAHNKLTRLFPGSRPREIRS